MDTDTYMQDVEAGSPPLSTTPQQVLPTQNTEHTFDSASNILHPKAESLLRWADLRDSYEAHLKQYRAELEHRKARLVDKVILDAEEGAKEEKQLRKRIADLRHSLNEISAQKIVNQALVDRLQAHHIIRTTLESETSTSTSFTEASSSTTPPSPPQLNTDSKPSTKDFTTLLRQRDAYASEYLDLTERFNDLSLQLQTLKKIMIHLLLDADIDWANHSTYGLLLEEAEGCWIDDALEEYAAHPAFAPVKEDLTNTGALPEMRFLDVVWPRSGGSGGDRMVVDEDEEEEEQLPRVLHSLMPLEPPRSVGKGKERENFLAEMEGNEDIMVRELLSPDADFQPTEIGDDIILLNDEEETEEEEIASGIVQREPLQLPIPEKRSVVTVLSDSEEGGGGTKGPAPLKRTGRRRLVPRSEILRRRSGK
ncbi:hypothetical protein HDV00_002844 [Rhizophlyctis rosea]|nr:hypothetical protein HDV00_002844 [Rhizophlyctis rosea]